jgi:hypothetical protein
MADLNVDVTLQTTAVEVQQTATSVEVLQQSTIVEASLISPTIDVTLQTIGIEVTLAGPSGAPGIGADKNYTQAFTTSIRVVVPHGLAKYPAVTVVDSANNEVVGDVVHDSIYSLTITFTASFSGVIFCN